MTEAALSSRVVLHLAVGRELSWNLLDVGAGTLERGGAVLLPAAVQYAWFHPRAPFLYAASSDRGPGRPGTAHHLSAFGLDPATSALRAHGAPVPIPTRPIHLCLDGAGGRILTVCNDPALLLVHAVGTDGLIGEELGRLGAPEAGFYPHQVHVLPGDRQAILVARGNDPANGRPEDPGALILLDLPPDGAPRVAQRVAPGGGYGFGPRHLDLHPNGHWVFVSVERQNRLQGFSLEGGRLSETPFLDRSTLADPDAATPEQWAGPIHVHPGGGHLTLANRPEHFVLADGARVDGGGENSLRTFRIDPDTGAATPSGTASPFGFHVRTFALTGGALTVDAPAAGGPTTGTPAPGAGVLVAASTRPRAVRGADGAIRTVPAGLAVFRHGADGALVPAGTHAVEVGEDALFWVGAAAA